MSQGAVANPNESSDADDDDNEPDYSNVAVIIDDRYPWMVYVVDDFGRTNSLEDTLKRPLLRWSRATIAEKWIDVDRLRLKEWLQFMGYHVSDLDAWAHVLLIAVLLLPDPRVASNIDTIHSPLPFVNPACVVSTDDDVQKTLLRDTMTQQPIQPNLNPLCAPIGKAFASSSVSVAGLKRKCNRVMFPSAAASSVAVASDEPAAKKRKAN